MIMTVSILEFGFAGGVIGMGLFAAANIYFTIPVWLILWNRNGRYHQKYGETEV